MALPTFEKNFLTVQGDRVDTICFEYYGFCKGAVEAVLSRNPWLVEHPPILPSGLVLVLPVLSTEQANKQLWEYATVEVETSTTRARGMTDEELLAEYRRQNAAIYIGYQPITKVPDNPDIIIGNGENGAPIIVTPPPLGSNPSTTTTTKAPTTSTSTSTTATTTTEATTSSSTTTTVETTTSTTVWTVPTTTSVIIYTPPPPTTSTQPTTTSETTTTPPPTTTTVIWTDAPTTEPPVYTDPPFDP